MRKVVLAGKETEERLKPSLAVANRELNAHECGHHETQFIRVSTQGNAVSYWSRRCTEDYD